MNRSLLDGVDGIINEALGLTIGRLKYHHKAQCQRFSKTPRPALDGQRLVRDVLMRIESNWHRQKSRSAENWRWAKNSKLAAANSSQEVILERLIARNPDDAWVNQVPVASGLTKTKADKRRAIDLVHRCGNGSYEFIELKVTERGGTPLFAAMEILQYGILYIFWRKNAKQLANAKADKRLAKATGIQLKVLAPVEYYAGYNLAWLEQSINRGLAKYTASARCGFRMDFRFEALSLIPIGSPVWKI